jgi:NAD(P)-dependent dehydrogenase (short-subunit alcohol dehydrogenase family)
MTLREELMSTQKRTWFVTGCSTGLGRTLVEAVLKAGGRVVATARNQSSIQDFVERYPDTALALPLDVTVPAQVQTAVEQAVAHFGQIDVVVNNAGYGLLGAVEEVTEAQIRQQFETNFFGSLNVTRAVLPILRQQGHGHILQISTAVAFGLPGLGIYNASKWALEGVSESLAAEMKPFGIKLTIIEPGGFCTDWVGRSLVHAKPADSYAATVGGIRDFVVTINAQPEQYQGDPLLFAQAMLRVADLDNPPLRLPLGQDSLDSVRQKMTAKQADLDQWESLSTFSNLAEPA